jgi:hypothetical protein
MHKYGFGQTHWKDLLKWILSNFILYFSTFIQVIMIFLFLNEFPEI